MLVYVMKDGQENCANLILVKVSAKIALDMARALRLAILMQSVYARTDSQVKAVRIAVMVFVLEYFLMVALEMSQEQ
jgi:hypothetical protein